MSSEQVIAEMRSLANAEGSHAITKSQVKLWADRLSTPAASTGDLHARMLELEHQRDDYLNREWIAEKAKRAAQSKLTALLDGIEGLPSGIVKEVGGSLVMIGELSEPYRASAGRVYIISAEKLDALRESSVPAIGET